MYWQIQNKQLWKIPHPNKSSNHWSGMAAHHLKPGTPRMTDESMKWRMNHCEPTIHQPTSNSQIRIAFYIADAWPIHVKKDPTKHCNISTNSQYASYQFNHCQQPVVPAWCRRIGDPRFEPLKDSWRTSEPLKDSWRTSEHKKPFHQALACFSLS